MDTTYWFESRTGKKIFPMHPDPQMVDIEDIGHSLANICRFGGHCREFYSVAQHSVMVSALVPDHLAMHGLMHDAAEAYVGDMVRPLKAQLDQYNELEHEWMRAIYMKLCPELYDQLTEDDHNEIKEADNRALMYEASHLIQSRGKDWEIDAYPLIMPWVAYDPVTAKKAFLRRWFTLQG